MLQSDFFFFQFILCFLCLGRKTWLLFSWGLFILGDYLPLVFVFQFFRLAWKINYHRGKGGRMVNKTHLYWTLSSNDSKRVQVWWDFNLLIKIRYPKTQFQSSFMVFMNKKAYLARKTDFSKQKCWKLCMKNASNDVTSLRNSISLCTIKMCTLDMQSWKLHVSV